MAKVDRSYIDAEFNEEHTLQSELESDELDREHRTFDGHGDDWEEFNKVEEPDDWFYEDDRYDYGDDYFDPYPLSMHDDFYD